jgi:hypothetical protein
MRYNIHDSRDTQHTENKLDCPSQPLPTPSSLYRTMLANVPPPPVAPPTGQPAHPNASRKKHLMDVAVPLTVSQLFRQHFTISKVRGLEHICEVRARLGLHMLSPLDVLPSGVWTPSWMNAVQWHRFKRLLELGVFRAVRRYRKRFEAHDAAPQPIHPPSARRIDRLLLALT